MKNIFLALTTLLLLGYNSNLNAQPRAYSDANYYLTVNGYSVGITNLYTLDSLRVPHFASFDVNIVSDPDSKKVLESLFSAAAGKQSLKISISTMNFQNQFVAQRNYNGAMVAELDVPELNGSSKDAMRLKVKILSPDMTESDKGQFNGKITSQAKVALASNYKVALGNLPTQRVSAITGLKTSSFNNTGYINFNIEVARVDSKQWKDWFNTATGKTEEGTITLLDQTRANDLAYLQVSGVEIVSVSESSNGDAIAKTVLGLRARRLSFSMK